MTKKEAIDNYRTMYRYMSEHYTEYLDRLREEIHNSHDKYTDNFSYLKTLVYEDLVTRNILKDVPGIDRTHCYLCTYVDKKYVWVSPSSCEKHCPILFKKAVTYVSVLNGCTPHCTIINWFLELILRRETPSPYLTAALSRFFAKVAELPENTGG